MNLLAAWLGGLALWLAVASDARAIGVVYQQPSDFPQGTVFASQRDPDQLGPFATTYDDFTVSRPSLITGVQWQGGLFNGDPGQVSQFTLTFWSDDAGEPSDPQLTAVIAGNAGETFVGEEFFGPVFDYQASLPSPFVSVAGQRYWLSIVPDLSFPPQWGWHSGTQGDGISINDFQGDRIVQSNDFAFTLIGVNAPEPSSIAIIVPGGIGLMFLYWWTQRRKHGLGRRARGCPLIAERDRDADPQ